jgi:2',3'-cyclic-nucleotide 2'-phosphodiesterase (5'-nucleotidase family)
LPILDKLDPSIALVISGHTHRAYICPHGEGTRHSHVFYTSAGKYGQALRDIDVTLDVSSDTIASVHAHNELIVNEAGPDPAPSAFPAYAPDPAVAALVARYTYWNARLPDGASKVVPNSVKVNGRPEMIGATYRVTVDAFLAEGGDAFLALVAGSAKAPGAIDLDALDHYITAHSPLSPGPLNRITREN